MEALEIEAVSASKTGNRNAAAAKWREVLELDKHHAKALNALGNYHLAKGEASIAVGLLERACAADMGQPALLFNLAMAARSSNDGAKALAALDRALIADPYFVQAMFQKALLLEEGGNFIAAARVYRDLIDCAPPEVLASAQFKPALDHARASIEADGARMSARAQTAAVSPRISEALDILAGKARPFVHAPTFFHIPQLPAIPFFDRDVAPWIDKLEAATPTILAELSEAFAGEAPEDAFPPYVANPPGTPLNQWEALDHSPQWGALHLWRHGKAVDKNIARFSATNALLASLPGLTLNRRAPNAFFSVLRNGAHIPPHTGVTNARSTVHLGLVIPDGCRFRVGNETRVWEAGKAWVFDDSIEHEAWNAGEKDRIILIFDIWNPLLKESEQKAIADILHAHDAHHGEEQSWSNS